MAAGRLKVRFLSDTVGFREVGRRGFLISPLTLLRSSPLEAAVRLVSREGS